MRKKYRAISKAYIHPERIYNEANDKDIVIYIPDPITYHSERELMENPTRWDFTFDVINGNVVIMIRHITMIDDNYMEVREMPEYYYDYETFVKLGGGIECQANTQSKEKWICRIDEAFNKLYPSFLKKEEKQLHIEPITEIMIKECLDEDSIKIPIPINHIVQNIELYSIGVNNCNRPLVDDTFFKALDAFKAGELKDKHCHITEDYVSVDDYSSEQDIGFIYDTRMQRVVDSNTWERECYKWTVKQKQEKKRALEKHGLFHAYHSLEEYLGKHNSIRKIIPDSSKEFPAPYQLVNVDLSYGYKLKNFRILEDSVIWTLQTYERAIKEKTYLCGMDECFLMYKKGKTFEVVRELDYRYYKGDVYFTQCDYDTYRNRFIELKS